MSYFNLIVNFIDFYNGCNIHIKILFWMYSKLY